MDRYEKLAVVFALYTLTVYFDFLPQKIRGKLEK